MYWKAKGTSSPILNFLCLCLLISPVTLSASPDTSEQVPLRVSDQNTTAVKIRVNSHAPRPWPRTDASKDALGLLQKSCPKEGARSARLWQSSFQDEDFESSDLFPSEHGFVFAAINAYHAHHHLVIRPDDVWLAIISQINRYVTKHSKKLRHLFVEHEGQKTLSIKHTGDWGKDALKFTDEIAQNIKDAELQGWMFPNFTTTQPDDRVAAAIVMMGSMQAYFQYEVMITCGIPSVTLLGERADWLELLKRIEYLPRLGQEPTQFRNVLEPVLKRFVYSYDNPTAPAVREFWNRVAHVSMGCDWDSLSGWITAFAFWDDDGKPLRKYDAVEMGVSTEFTLDRVRYHHVDFGRLPSGSASVPVLVKDTVMNKEYPSQMIAGSVAMRVTESGEKLDERSNMRGEFNVEENEGVERGTGPDTLAPVIGWWMSRLKEETSTASGDRGGRAFHPEVGHISMVGRCPEPGPIKPEFDPRVEL